MTKSARWALGVSALAVLGAALVLAFVLSLSTSGWLAERHFVWLFWVNVAVAGLLLLVIGLGAARLVTRLKRGKFGSRLLAKLAGVFALVGVVPGLLIYGVSYQFVTRSIDTWFDVQVAQALDAGLSLGRSTLDAAVADLSNQARTAAERLADARQLDARLPEGKQPIGPLALERTRQQLGVRDAVLLGANGQVLASAGGSNAALVPERPAAALLRQARLQRSVGVLEGLDDEPQAGARPSARVRAVALVPNTDINLAAANEERFLMLVQPLPDALVANALAVQAAYREYQQRALARDGLRRMVVGTLTLSLVLSVFGALLLAVSLGNQIVRPLLLVADGVRQVAEGDLTAKPVFASRDELGGLTRSFAQMTEQLSDARAQVQRGVAQLEGARTRLQTILDSLTAGVIVFDRQGAIDTVNPGATRILRQPLSAYRGRPLAEVPGLAEFSNAVWQRSEMHRTSPEDGERDHWQDAFELQLGKGESLNLLLRGASLPGDARLLVFDDITEVVSGQRSVAWAEVARRLAHEIKNPLTPIQLSAERLEHKLAAKLDAEADRAMLSRSVATIVAQVQAMKQLVDEFRDYARLPAAQLHPLDLNALVLEVLGLYAAPQEQGRLQARLAEALPLIEGDTSQLRQVIHNLVQNALDAVEQRPDGLVQVITETARNDGGELRAVRLRVSDNGGGFGDKVLKRAFEPYVTTKPKGTGLGLAVVKKIADEHGARVRIVNRRAEPVATADGVPAEGAVIGAQVSLSFSRFAPAQIPHAPDMPATASPQNPTPATASRAAQG
ncbi:sensor histidine kinase [Pseudaquabacterium pictum]|uniref:histidine kinase n=1 Tax=Pseudaquabacterium pictum TaxID=2315236 RepID=A0A480AZA5_9BURK|nr:ATP-binding protein [Rubrivivax pictus]GCL66256.1 PAS domain-containing sensor histidine kinase [Rubrivivax pictus]